MELSYETQELGEGILGELLLRDSRDQEAKACSAIPHHELPSDELREFVDKTGVTAHLFLQQSGVCRPSEVQLKQMIDLLVLGQVQSGAPGTRDEFRAKLKKAHAIVAFTSAEGQVLALSSLKPVQILGTNKFSEKGSTCGLGLPGSGKHMSTILREAAQRDKIDFMFVETVVSNYASFQMNMRVQPTFRVVGFFNEKYDPTALSMSSTTDARTVLVITITMFPLGQASEQETDAAVQSLRDYYRDDVFSDYEDCKPGEAAPEGAISRRPLLQLYRNISGEEVDKQVALDPTFRDARGDKAKNQLKAWLVQSDTISTGEASPRFPTAASGSERAALEAVELCVDLTELPIGDGRRAAHGAEKRPEICVDRSEMPPLKRLRVKTSLMV